MKRAGPLAYKKPKRLIEKLREEEKEWGNSMGHRRRVMTHYLQKWFWGKEGGVKGGWRTEEEGVQDMENLNRIVEVCV